MPATLTALSIAILAIVPGAVWTFAFESRVGPYKASAPDRLVRFLAASVVLHALTAGLTYLIYQNYFLTGAFAQGKVNAWMVELLALSYVLVPYIAGRVVGSAYVKDWRIVQFFNRNAWYPRAWDFIFSQQRPAYLRLRLKSERWIGGLYGTADPPGGYASTYGEEADLFLNPSVDVDQSTGVFLLDEEGRPVPNGALLVRWTEVEYVEFQLLEESDAEQG